MSLGNDKTKDQAKDVDDLRQADRDPQLDGEDKVEISSSQSATDEIQALSPYDDTETLKIPPSATEGSKPILFKQDGTLALINVALWLSIIASSIIIFAFLSGLASLQEGLEFISETPVTPAPLLSGSLRNWLPSAEDVPDEMQHAGDFSYSNEDIAKRYDNPVEVFNILVQNERGDNFHRKYLHRDGCGSKTGFREASIQAILFEGVSGAEEQLDWNETNLTALLKSTRVNSIENVGERGFIMWYDDSSTCTPPDDLGYVGIVFQRYNAIGSIWVGTVQDTVSEDEMQSLAVRLAQIMDLRFVAEAKK